MFFSFELYQIPHMGKYFHVDRARRTCIMYSVSKHGNKITKVYKITWFLRKKWIKKWREVVLRILQRFCGCFEKHSTGKHKENVRTVYNLFDHWNMVLSSDFQPLKTHLATRLVLHLFWRWQPVAGCWHAPFHCYVASLIVAGPYFLALLSGACHLLSRCVAQQLDSNNSVDLPRGPSVVAYTCIYVSQLESFLTLLTADLSKDNYAAARKWLDPSYLCGKIYLETTF